MHGILESKILLKLKVKLKLNKVSCCIKSKCMLTFVVVNITSIL